MKIGIAEIRNSLAEAINQVAYQGERIVLERRGNGVAALVSMEDLELLEALEDQVDVEAARLARKEGGKPIPLADVETRLGIASPAESKPKKKAAKRKARKR